MLDLYYDYGIKVKRPEELQTDYLELLADRLGQVGLDMPDGIEADYELPRDQWHAQENLFGAGEKPRGQFPGPWDKQLAEQQAVAR